YTFAIGGPNSLVAGIDGNLYGSTLKGGDVPPQNGSLFRVDPSGGVATIHNFVYGEGAGPTTVVQSQDGNLYGATSYRGIYGQGATVFRLDTAGTLTTLHRFTDGAVTVFNGDAGGVAQFEGANGDIYVTTVIGGAYGYGSVFSIGPSGYRTILHDFNGVD